MWLIFSNINIRDKLVLYDGTARILVENELMLNKTNNSSRSDPFKYLYFNRWLLNLLDYANNFPGKVSEFKYTTITFPSDCLVISSKEQQSTIHSECNKNQRLTRLTPRKSTKTRDKRRCSNIVNGEI